MDKVVQIRKNNRSQIFIFDLIFSIVIIVVSIAVAFSNYSNTLSNEDLYNLNSQILNGFTQTEINSLNDVAIRDMFINGKIKNIHNTIAQQVTDFLLNSDINSAKNLTSIYVNDYISRQMNFNLSMKNSSGSIVTLFYLENIGNKFEDAQITSSSKRKIISFTNTTNGYQIYTFEVRIWV